MDAIVLFSHGSLLCGSGEALKQHAERLRVAGLAPIVEVGYLNYTEPLFARAVERCLRAGARRILVTPYFLVPGYFVNTALPACAETARKAHPTITFVIAEPIGFDSRLADALMESAESAVEQPHWRDDLKSASAHCIANPSCPLYNTPACPKHPANVLIVGENNTPSRIPDTADVGSIHPFTPSPSHPLSPAEAGETPALPGVPVTLAPSRPRTLSARHPTPDTRHPLTPAAALLIMVHGSPKPSANADMFRVVEIVRERNLFSAVEAGFMECNSPSIPAAIDLCIAAGVSELVAVPYFLHTGKHVADDLPTLLEEAQARNRHVSFRMGSYLGRSAALTHILADRARSAM